MKNILKYLLLIVIVEGFVACQEELEVGDAGSLILSGDWTVTEYSLDGESIYGPYELQIYNTANDENSLWIENIYDSGYKIKVNKLSETTFGAIGAADINEEHEGMA